MTTRRRVDEEEEFAVGSGRIEIIRVRERVRRELRKKKRIRKLRRVGNMEER